MRIRQWPRPRPTLVVLSVVLWVGALTAAETATPAPARRLDSEARLRRDITLLASDEYEGRGPGTRGIDKAADLIAAEFKKAGLKPGGADGSYFQPFTIPAAILDEPAHLALTGPRGQQIELKQGIHFWPMGLGHAGKDSGPIVFAGYGITSPKAKYDDYEGLDVAEKIVVLLRDAPPAADKDVARELKNQAFFFRKLANAEKHKAAAVLIVNDAETARTGDDLLDFNYTGLGRPAPSKVPVFHLRRSVLEAMLPGGADTLTDIEKSIERELKPHSRELPGWTASLEVKMHRGKLPLKNVVGVLEGAGPLADETIVVGAHYDHLGYGGNSSLAGLKKMAIHHGADDNASGTTSVLELARRFAANPSPQPLSPGGRGAGVRGRRRLVFMAFSGEELGLYGSAHYCKQPLYPLAGTAAMFNLDMVGRLRTDRKTGKDKLLSEGSGTAKPFAELLDGLARKHDFTLVKKPSGFGPSDHASFCAKKVPVLFFWTDYHDDYHRPSDTADKINVAGMRRIVDVSEEVVSYLATMTPRPAFVEVKGGSGGSPGFNGPRLGIRPSYSDDGEGVLIGGVSEGQPAAKAGLKADDRIVQLAGKPVKNLETYMEIMKGHKKGDTLEVVVIRDGKKVPVKVKLE